VRGDVEALAAHARSLGLYSTLVTSGIGLTKGRADALKEAGLDHVQISIQDTDEGEADRIAGMRGVRQKMAAAAIVRERGFAFSINVVLHRANIDHVGKIIELAAELGADRLELANTQYYGWALANRNALMPTRAQVAAAAAIAEEAMPRHADRMQILYVLPDYFESSPKPCYGGWGRHYLVVMPDGRVLPCHGATQITTLEFDNVRDRSMRAIWETSSAFEAFRGDAWMREPCRTCEKKDVDFGGCRCQAFALTGAAENADPVCTLTSTRAIVDAAIEDAAAAAATEYRYRYIELEPARP
jgi:pyrroloquinoline quinone biosynthesis protein E